MRRVVFVAALAGCGRVGFDSSMAVDGMVDGMVDGAIAQDLLVWLPFDDDPADGAMNRGKTLDAGTCAPSCPTRVTGKHGGAYSFADGQALRLPRPATLELTEGTVAAWISVDQLPVTGATQVIIGTAFSSDGRNTWEMFLYGNASSGTPHAASGGDVDGIGGYADVPWTLASAWVHFAMTWQANGMQRIVLDGVTRMTAPAFVLAYDPHDIIVGGDEETLGLRNFWQGAIDDLMITDRVLSDAEIAALSARGT